MQDRDVLIRAETIAGWRRRLADLDKERTALISKLEVVQEMTQEESLEELDSLESHRETNGRKHRGKVAAVVDVLSKSIKASGAPKPMTPKEIREHLIQSGTPEAEWGDGFAYLYSVLKRLKDSGQIKEVGNGYVMRLGDLLASSAPPVRK
jgi:hypothetical protein